MLFSSLIKQLDELLCNYLGLNSQEIRLHSIRKKNNKLIIISTFSFKRHLLQENLHEFNTSKFNQLSSNDREKLGLATGKVLAKGLSISFEENPIDEL